MAMAVANRYARALADVVARTGDFRQVRRELEDFIALYRESAELREVLSTPAVALAQKSKVLDAVLARLGISKITFSFLHVLLKNYRMGLLEEVELAFRRISNARLGIAPVKVYAASELSESEKVALQTRFAELTGKQVELEFHLEGLLLGGVLAQVGSTVYDGSVRGHLERFREQLMAR